MSMLLGYGILLSLFLVVHDLLRAIDWLNLDDTYWLPCLHVLVFLLFAGILFQHHADGIKRLKQKETLKLCFSERELALGERDARALEALQRELLYRERQRIVREMHDGLGGTLAVAFYMTDSDQFDRQALHAALHDCVDELRLTMDMLESDESDLSALIASLRSRLQARVEAAGLTLRWQAQALPLLPWLTPEHMMHVVRIVQEVTTNIIKHAGACEIVFLTEARGDYVCLHVDDDGVGFDLTPPSAGNGAARDQSRGVVNITYRADALGGCAQWTRRAEGGTRFTLWIPLRRAGQPEDDVRHCSNPHPGSNVARAESGASMNAKRT